MRKLTTVLAIVFGILDAAVVAAIVFLMMQNNATAAGSAPEEAVAYESNEASYYDESDHNGNYSGMIIAAREKGMVTPEPTPVVTPEPTPIATPTPTATPEPTPTATPEPTPTATPEPTPTAAPAPNPAEIPDGDFIYPNSESELISQEAMAVLTDAPTWQRAVNEIYARHGYQFHQDKNPTDYAYFNSLPWYQAMPKVDSADAVKASFNAVENANVEALVAYRKAVGY